MTQITSKVKQFLNDNIEIGRPTKLGGATMYLIYIGENGRNLLRIDQVLAFYLVDVAEMVKPFFYKKVSCFIQLLRSCMNQNGFEFETGIVPIEEN